MDEMTMIILNGIFWMIAIPVFSSFFPKAATAMRFMPPSVDDEPEPIVYQYEPVVEEEVQQIHIDDVLDFKPTMPKEEPIQRVVEEVEVVKEPEELTSKQLADDAILALVSTGFKKKEAKIAVTKAVRNRRFDNVQDIVIAALDRSNT
jgi:hypothetical protein